MTFDTSKRGHLIRNLALLVFALAFAGSPAFADQVETLKDKFAPGILLEGTKDVLPQGVKLRPVFQKGIDVTKKGEGWVAKRYNDAAGYCTIGYGHLLKKSKCDGTGNEVEFLNGISLKRGEELLIEDMRSAQITVQLAAPQDLTDGEYASLVDFTFNVGGANFKGSTLLKVVKQKQFDRVPEQFNRWTKAGGKEIAGLKNRRAAEIKLFFDGKPIPRPAPIPGEDLSPLDIDIGKGEAAK
ncbi:glycoside hydrolase family protein [Rhizobium leguminosarum]|uniref:lysozyme n=1 Tax=Rhizobium ruizarguesonis TaxID=2081791 RepID=UPI0013BE3130|nr:lysozyme [Rhizobium ruizarguesonis]NEI08727.1 glycoside hydrolase family protein [Rhizobium ruizarguesonis]